LTAGPGPRRRLGPWRAVGKVRSGWRGHYITPSTGPASAVACTRSGLRTALH